MALAPESPLVEQIVQPEKREQLASFLAKMSLQDKYKRISTESEKEGFFLGRYAVNPVNGEKIPIYVANYILMEYGTGAIMGVPAHDQRDYEFAKKYNLDIKVVIQPHEKALNRLERAYDGDGIMVNSGELNGTEIPTQIEKVFTWLENKKIGKQTIQYTGVPLFQWSTVITVE